MTFTLDMEDHRTGTSAPIRCSEPTARVLEWLAGRNARGTVFVVGELAEQCPDIIRSMAAAGHEVALHGLRHAPIEDIGEENFFDELQRGKKMLEDITGRPVVGYRAPYFSLTRRTPWAVPMLAEAGFSYSSSVLPASNPLYGMSGVPQAPFRWRDGPIELPCPVMGRGRLALPFLGGVYLRYLPMPAIRAGIRRIPGDMAVWSYLHPYDLDPDESFEVLPNVGYVTSRIVYHRRRRTMVRMDRLVEAAGGLGPPLAEVAETVAAQGAPVVSIGGASGARPGGHNAST